MTPERAAEIWQEVAPEKHYVCKSLFFIGKKGITDVRVINLGEITEEKFREYVDILKDRE